MKRLQITLRRLTRKQTNPVWDDPASTPAASDEVSHEAAAHIHMHYYPCHVVIGHQYEDRLRHLVRGTHASGR